MKLLTKCLLLLSVLAALSSCGGGSGGGTGTKSTRSASTGVRILHGSIDAAPFEVLSSENPEVVQRARFFEDVVYAQLPTTAQTLSLREVTSSNFLFSAALTVSKNEQYSLLIFGDADNLGRQAKLILDTPPQLSQGSSAMRLIHAVVGAANLDLLIDGVEQVSNLAFGNEGSYLELPSGIHTFSVKRSSDGRVLYEAPLTLDSNSAYSLLLGGEVDFLALTKLLSN